MILTIKSLGDEIDYKIPLVVLEEIVRVAIQQHDVEWPMSCYEEARRLLRHLKEETL